MKDAIVLTRAEIRKIIAVYYNIDEKDVLPSKFSYTVIIDKSEKDYDKSIIKL